MENYKISEWIKIYNHNNSVDICFFQPLDLKVLIGDEEAKEILEKFAVPQDLNYFTEMERELVDLFRKFNFIIPTNESDDKRFIQERTKLINLHKDIDITNKKFSGLRIILTEKCNLRCSYCYVRRDVHYFKDMSEEVMLKAVDLLINYNLGGEVTIQFSGGEPLTRFSMIQKCVNYIEEFIDKGEIIGCNFALETNATLITDEIASFLADKKFIVAVSLDGSKEINDTHRIYHNGQGTYNDVVKGIEILQKYSVILHIDLTPTITNIGEIGNMYKYFVNHIQCKTMTINTPQPGPEGWGVSGKLLAREIIKCKEYAKRVNGYVESLADRVYVGLATGEPQILSCSTFSDTLTGAVSPDGKISYCIVSWSLEESTQPVENFSFNSNFKMWKYNELYIKEDCHRCPAINVCGGPCSLEGFYEDHYKNKDIERCRFYREILKWAIWE